MRIRLASRRARAAAGRWTLAVAAVAALLLVIGHAPSPARAGSRDVELLFLRLDDGTDPDATACVNTVRRTVTNTGAGWIVHLVSLPRDALMTRMGVTSFDGFVSWPRERLATALNERQARDLDAVMLLDCQPAEQRLDVVVIAGTGEVGTAEPQRLSIRNTAITPEVMRFAGQVAGVWKETDFSP